MATLPTRKTFFQDVRALTRYFYFPSWQGLLRFMMRGLEIGPYAKAMMTCEGVGGAIQIEIVAEPTERRDSLVVALVFDPLPSLRHAANRAKRFSRIPCVHACLGARFSLLLVRAGFDIRRVGDRRRARRQHHRRFPGAAGPASVVAWKGTFSALSHRGIVTALLKDGFATR